MGTLREWIMRLWGTLRPGRPGRATGVGRVPRPGTGRPQPSIIPTPSPGRGSGRTPSSAGVWECMP